MAIITDSKNVPLKEVVSQNFRERKFEIMIPAIKGISASIGTILILATNPYGWTFGPFTLISGLVIAALSIIAAIGYSIYLLTKQHAPIKNSVTI